MQNSTIVVGAAVAGVAVAAYAAYRGFTDDGLGYLMPAFFAFLLFATAFGVAWGATPVRGASSASPGIASWLKGRTNRGSPRR
jgi:hypothetical protein